MRAEKQLSRALVRISASLDLDTVLREVVDSARAVTGARFGVITTADEKGLPHRFLTSGIEPENHRRLAVSDDRRLLYEHFRELRRPVRVGDLASYVRTLGIDASVFPGNTLQATPIRHQGVYLGSLFLADKEGGPAFTEEDEALLVPFASQAAAAIANACAYRDELRARAKLETLVETAPVGMVLFDARTGGLVSWNREAARIVEGLKMPDLPIDELLKIVTSRGADGVEVDLSKDPAMSDELRRGETLRNAEVVLSVPDGRSVRTLVNVTPIHAADGAVEFVVVTMQDLAPFEDAGRIRVTNGGEGRGALSRQTEPEPFELGELAIDYERRHVTLAGRLVHLTATEYEVLRLLSAKAGRVLTYHFLLRHAWVRYPDRARPKLVHAVVKRLRGKLGENAATAAYILNERHVGYRMPAPGD